MEDDPARRSGREHAVDDNAVEVYVRIEGGPEAVNEGDRAETGRETWPRTVHAAIGHSD